MANSLFDKALRDHRARQPADGRPDDLRVVAAGAAETKQPRQVGGETFEVTESQTLQPIDEDSWLNVQEYGIPRGPEAWEASQLGETAAMEIVKNTVTDQITGGDLAFVSEEDDDDDLPDEIADLQDWFRQILSGPHLLGDDFDDIVTAAVSDMIDVGDAYWQCLPAESQPDTIPVLALKPLDALTMRLNIDEHGNWKDDEAAYYQAPYQSYAGDSIALGDTEPVELGHDDVVSLRWPNSRRSDRVYPMSPTLQVKKWLELLSNNTTHVNRFYADNEIPPGLMQVIEATEDDVDTIASKIEDASGDPRTAPVVGGSGEAKWIEMGGTALNLDIIEEQKWFLQLVWGAIGLNKHEIGLIEDVNRSTSSEQSATIYKRVTDPLTETVDEAVNTQILDQFDVYTDLGRPFQFSLNRSDPERDAVREQELLERYQAGAISYNSYHRQIGEEPEDTEVTLPNDETFDYGPHPKNVGEILINAYKNAGGPMGDPMGGPGDPGDPDEPVDEPVDEPGSGSGDSGDEDGDGDGDGENGDGEDSDGDGDGEDGDSE